MKECEMLRSRGEQFIDSLYNALDQGKPVKLINSKGYTVSVSVIIIISNY